MRGCVKRFLSTCEVMESAEEANPKKKKMEKCRNKEKEMTDALCLLYKSNCETDWGILRA